MGGAVSIGEGGGGGGGGGLRPTTLEELEVAGARMLRDCLESMGASNPQNCVCCLGSKSLICIAKGSLETQVSFAKKRKF